jgi:hypothetical protein
METAELSVLEDGEELLRQQLGLVLTMFESLSDQLELLRGRLAAVEAEVIELGSCDAPLAR